MKILSRNAGPDLKRQALVVEADSGTREICRAALEGLGFSVNAVDSGVAAVTTARQTKPDVVLFDLQLRDVSGHDLVNWLRANPALHDVPLIAISVLSRDDGAGSIENQVAGVVKKPVSRNALKSTVRHALGMGAGH